MLQIFHSSSKFLQCDTSNEKLKLKTEGWQILKASRFQNVSWISFSKISGTLPVSEILKSVNLGMMRYILLYSMRITQTNPPKNFQNNFDGHERLSFSLLLQLVEEVQLNSFYIFFRSNDKFGWLFLWHIGLHSNYNFRRHIYSWFYLYTIYEIKR